MDRKISRRHRRRVSPRNLELTKAKAELLAYGGLFFGSLLVSGFDRKESPGNTALQKLREDFAKDFLTSMFKLMILS